MNIITGYRGEPHITSAQDRAGNQGSYGTASYVLNVGSKFAASVISANEIHIADGILSHQGCLAIIETGTYDSVSINNGAQGMNRIDRIVARYTKDSETNVESVELAVIQGTATASTPTAPDYNHGTIANGNTPVDMPLYQVRLTGITVASVTAEFATVRTQKEMDTLLGNTSISGIGNGTVTGAISTLNSKIESVRFNGTAGSIGAGNCVGTYDKASNTVRVIFHWSSNNAYASGTTLFTVPSQYRPSGSYNGSCYAYRSDLQITGLCTINSSGQISQGAAATANGGFGVIEYPL